MAESRTGLLMRATTTAMAVTDLGFIVYWTLVIDGALPAAAMLHEYADHRLAAWYWSFLPLDGAASLSGLAALRATRRDRPTAPAMLTLSLALTATAGGMAVVYFAQRGEFDPSWMLPNLALLLFP